MPDDADEWSDWDHSDAYSLNQLELYEHKPSPLNMRDRDSPILYWISKLTIWPQLAQMALNVFSTPAISDEPECVFSIAGNAITPCCRVPNGNSM